MSLLFFDLDTQGLKPLVFTRPAADLRLGIWTIQQKWEQYMNCPSSFLSEAHLREKYACQYSTGQIYVNGKLLPTPALVSELNQLQEGEALFSEGTLLALRSDASLDLKELASWKHGKDTEEIVRLVEHCYNLFEWNDQELRADFEQLHNRKHSAALPDHVIALGEDIYVEEGAQVNPCTLNSTTGPIYIGKDAEVMEGSTIRGPFAACEHAVVKMGAKIYGATTLGPYCKVGGELNNVVMQGFSNKGHDGFLGNAVIGEWCNLGADSNNSNLKNNYADVKLWNYQSGRFQTTGLQFCGLIMGDHSKCGINSMFNTGTVIGVSANIFGSGFPRNFVPSFSWGGSHGFTTYSLNKVFETIERVMDRRGQQLNETDKNILKHIFEASAVYRVWENK